MSASSGAGWSEQGNRRLSPEESPRDSEFAFTREETSRYENLTVLGSGGMGEVSVAFDARLGREVALKRVSAAIDDSESRGLLEREASITARLEHPNIVPVHDAGVDEEGRFFYTMRIVRGQSLEQALANVDGAQQLSLVRHYLDACHALAYAHSLGIVHRDVKPANIIVGQLGETLVVDWGLAAEDGETAGARSVGTPGFMSPEQVEGALPSPRADVWSLGMILQNIIETTTPDADLQAIADKALAVTPENRYETASFLADDIRRYLDGHRVCAREYSSWELLRRLSYAWRIPLAIAGLAVLVVTGVVVVSIGQVRDESARALTAEASTTAALAQTQQSLAWALESQAAASQSSGALPEAELLAAQALQLGESPSARGVLAGAYAGIRPTLLEQFVLPPCPSFQHSDGSLLVCANGDQLSLWELRPLRKRWSRPLAARAAQMAADTVVVNTVEGQIVLLDQNQGAMLAKFSPLGNLRPTAVSLNGRFAAATNGATLDLLDITRAEVRMTIAPCMGRDIEAMAVGNHQFIVVCSGGLLVAYDHASENPVAQYQLPFGTTLRPAAAAAISIDGRVAVGGIGGQVLLVDLPGRQVSNVVDVDQGAITQLGFVGQKLLVVAENGGASIWNVDNATELMRIPGKGSLAVVNGHQQLTMIGEALHAWRLPEQLQPLRFQSPEGLAAAALSPNGIHIAAAAGDGQVRVWNRQNGRLLASLQLTELVVKSVAFSPDGTLLAAGTADPAMPSAIVAVSDWQRVSHPKPPRAIHRVAYRDDGTLVAALYGYGLARWTSLEHHDIVETGLVRDLSVVGHRTIALLNSGDILESFDAAKPKKVAVDLNARAIAGLAGSSGIAIAHSSQVRVSGLGSERVLTGVSGQYVDIAVSPDARYVAAASIIGSVDVWDLESSELVAILRGHTERVSHLSFDSAGVLATASWDGSIRLWNLAPLSISPETLLAQAIATWSQVDATPKTSEAR